MSRLLNRLGANAMQATMKTGKKPFTVCLTGSQASAAQMAGFTKPEELITALHEAKHTVDMGIVTRPTSFGFGLSIKEGTTYTNIPLLLPLDSGLQLLASSDTQDQDHDKILVPACHGGVFLSVSLGVPAQDSCMQPRVKSPPPLQCSEGILMGKLHVQLHVQPLNPCFFSLWFACSELPSPAMANMQVSGPLVDCKVEWYQGIEGFTGWHNGWAAWLLDLSWHRSVFSRFWP